MNKLKPIRYEFFIRKISFYIYNTTFKTLKTNKYI